MTKQRFVIYSRQSKESGLSGQMTLETADWTIRTYLDSLGVEGEDYEIVACYEEIASGYKGRAREGFAKAIKHCYDDTSISLLVSNIVRFSRHTASGARILEDINVVVASDPYMEHTMKLFALVWGEKESADQSKRRKAAYQAKKARCEATNETFIWGGNSPKHKESFQANKSNHKKNVLRQQTRDAQQGIVDHIKTIVKYSSQVLSKTRIAVILNEEGLTTLTGKPFSQQTVSKLCKTYNIVTG